MSSELRAAADEVSGGLVGGDGSSGAPRVVEGAVSVERVGDRKVGVVDGSVPASDGAVSASNIEDYLSRKRAARADPSDPTIGRHDAASGDIAAVNAQPTDGVSAAEMEGLAAPSVAASADPRALACALESTHLRDGEEETSVDDPAAKRPRTGTLDGTVGGTTAGADEGVIGGKEIDRVEGANVEDQMNSDDEWTRGGMESDGDAMSVQSFDFSSSGSETDGEEEAHPKAALLSRRFDANLVVASIERGEPVLEQVEGRDVVLVCGKTGTGKSTLIQLLAGRSLQETKHSSSIRRGSETVTASKIVYDAVDPLPGFEIGHAKTSKTSNIGCFDPNQIVKDVGMKGSASNLVYVDSPGFEDTNGQEVDIATSVMLSQVAKRCRSLRFVIMISFVTLLEDRGGAMRSVMRLIRSFTKEFKDERQSFLFLFTHSNEVMGIPDSIEGAKAHLQNELVSTMVQRLLPSTVH